MKGALLGFRVSLGEGIGFRSGSALGIRSAEREVATKNVGQRGLGKEFCFWKLESQLDSAVPCVDLCIVVHGAEVQERFHRAW